QEDYVAALEVMAQLLVDDTSDPDTVDEMERLAKVAGAEHRLAELFEAAVLRSEVDDEGTMRLASRAGQVFAEGDGPEDERALLLLRRALRFEPENRKLFQLVDRLLTRSGTTEELVELYRTALEHRFDPDEQVSLLHQIADLS